MEICPLNPESQPRGGNAFQFYKGKDKGKGKGKHKGKKGNERGQGTKRPFEDDSSSLSPPFPPHRLVLPSTQRTILITGTAASTPIQVRPLLCSPFPLRRNPTTIVIFTVGTFHTVASPAKTSVG
jgi:hypothetical protein